ncbi:MAG TPA: spore coat U domain-containing protein, partial [Thermoanaerobaculia bacterium]|nr:spore coat U domain-containing protein [Thermoanaerobaculia bacterium]
KLSLLNVSLAAALVVAPAAFAATTADINVSANVDNACSITGGNLAFGLYTWEADKDQSMDLTVKCTTGADYDVTLGDGLQPASGQRKMSDGTNFLNYGLFSDTPGGTAWNAAAFVSATGNGGNQTHSVYGRIPAGQSTVPASAGADYLDTVVATVVFTP